MERFVEACSSRVVWVDAEAPAVGDVLLPAGGLTEVFFACAEGVRVDDGDTGHDAEARAGHLHFVDDAQEEARAVLEAPTVDAVACVGAEALVQEVAMTALHVDEGIARLLGDARRLDEALADGLELGVRHRLGL